MPKRDGPSFFEALRRGETPEDGARREAEEEVAPVPAYVVAKVIVTDYGGWSCTTVVGDAVEPVAVEPVTYEHTSCRWVTLEELADLPLHPGLVKDGSLMARVA